MSCFLFLYNNSYVSIFVCVQIFKSLTSPRETFFVVSMLRYGKKQTRQSEHVRHHSHILPNLPHFVSSMFRWQHDDISPNDYGNRCESEHNRQFKEGYLRLYEVTNVPGVLGCGSCSNLCVLLQTWRTHSFCRW